MTQRDPAGQIRLIFNVMAIAISHPVMMLIGNTSLHTEGIRTHCVDIRPHSPPTKRHVQDSRLPLALHSRLVWRNYRAVACHRAHMIVDLQGNLGGLEATRERVLTLDKQVAKVARGEVLRHDSLRKRGRAIGLGRGMSEI